MRFLYLLLIFFCFPLPGSAQQLKLGVAASLAQPFQDIKAAYYAQSNKTISITTASSGVLSAQIQNGSPLDLFFSANMYYPRQLKKKGFGVEPPSLFVYGNLVGWSALSNKNNLFINQLTGAKLIAVANPKLAPYGKAAKDWLKEQGLWETVAPRLVYGENIGQVNRYVAVGAVDVAFTAVSAMHAKPLAQKGSWYPLEASERGVLANGMLVLTSNEAVTHFLEFLNSKAAKEIFRKYGYTLPES